MGVLPYARLTNLHLKARESTNLEQYLREVRETLGRMNIGNFKGENFIFECGPLQILAQRVQIRHAVWSCEHVQLLMNGVVVASSKKAIIYTGRALAEFSVSRGEYPKIISLKSLLNHE